MNNTTNNKQSSINIMITGGHLTPALAVLNELKKRGCSNFIWVGHKFSMIGDINPDAEYREIVSKKIPFIDLKTGKLYRTFSKNAVISFFRIPYGFIQALCILLTHHPDLVMSFGGYLAAPIAFWAWVLQIPVFTHEQTVTVGRANKFIQKFSKKVFLSWQKSYDNLSEKDKKSEKFIVTGNPLRTTIFEKRTSRFNLDNDKKTVYITGGNQGSHIINENVLKILPELLKKYNVIHQCGSTTIYNDIETLANFREGLSEGLKNSYIVQKGFWEDEIGAVFANADIIVSRSGANIVTEILALTKPCVLIPIPWSANNEQYLNAKMVEETGLGKILEQKDLCPEKLFGTLQKALKIKISNELKNKAINLIKIDAVAAIVDKIVTYPLK